MMIVYEKILLYKFQKFSTFQLLTIKLKTKEQKKKLKIISLIMIGFLLFAVLPLLAQAQVTLKEKILNSLFVIILF